MFVTVSVAGRPNCAFKFFPPCISAACNLFGLDFGDLHSGGLFPVDMGKGYRLLS